MKMKTKWYSVLALVALSLGVVLVSVALSWRAVVGWVYKSYVASPMPSATNTVELRQTLEKCSSEPEIQREVDSLFSRFGDNDSKSLGDVDLSTTPAVARLARALSDDPLLDIVPNEYFQKGVPRHIRIRFGTHSHYRYILIFRAGSDLSAIKLPLEQVVNNVYFKP